MHIYCLHLYSVTQNFPSLSLQMPYEQCVENVQLPLCPVHLRDYLLT